ncbi:hypothetical protein J6590_040530 [Homalodisca vitripennis]|nr:hypothetical protein J6590_040530 [Homalodisca vitripennis]
MDAYERGSRGYEAGREMRGMEESGRGRQDNNQRSRWGPAGDRRQPEDYPAKRRRY